MTSELVVDVQPKEISIALMEDKNLVEFQKEERNLSFSVGNMYVGKVRKLMPGLNACFVDVGFEKDAFLHYLDLGPQFHSYQKYLKQVISDRKKLYPMSKASMLPDIEKDGTISSVLQQGQEVIVQIVKEPISTQAATDLRIVVRRTLSGTDTFQRQSIRFTKNKIQRGKSTPQTTAAEHQA